MFFLLIAVQKLYKIKEAFLELWSQMYCHVFYESQCISIISVKHTLVAAAGKDADVVDGNAGKRSSKLRNKHQLQRPSTSENHKSASPRAARRPTSDPLRPSVHLVTADVHTKRRVRRRAVRKVPETETVTGRFGAWWQLQLGRQQYRTAVWALRVDVTATYITAKISHRNTKLKRAARGSVKIQDAKNRQKFAIYAPSHNFVWLCLHN